MKEPELNQIFFGPPGTGKTYNTINEAIKIADPEFYKANHDNREELKKRFKLLLEETASSLWFSSHLRAPL